MAEIGNDGISYLMNAIASGFTTTLIPEYEAELLNLTGKEFLQEALQKVMTL